MVTEAEIFLKELERLPKDFPRLDQMKKIWHLQNPQQFQITNCKRLARVKQEAKEKVDYYLTLV